MGLDMHLPAALADLLPLDKGGLKTYLAIPLMLNMHILDIVLHHLYIQHDTSKRRCERALKSV